MECGFRSKQSHCRDHAFSHHTVRTPGTTLKHFLICTHFVHTHSSQAQGSSSSLRGLQHMLWVFPWQVTSSDATSQPSLQPSIFTSCLKIRNQTARSPVPAWPTLGFSNISGANILSTAFYILSPEGGPESSDTYLSERHKPEVFMDGQGSSVHGTKRLRGETKNAGLVLTDTSQDSHVGWGGSGLLMPLTPKQCQDGGERKGAPGENHVVLNERLAGKTALNTAHRQSETCSQGWKRHNQQSMWRSVAAGCLLLDTEHY